MITLTCERCGQAYAPSRGHDCPEGASRAAIPWKERSVQYHRDYAREYMQRKRAGERKAHVGAFPTTEKRQ